MQGRPILIRHGRVAPVLKKAIKDGKINLTAIVNTHQYVSPVHIRPATPIVLTHTSSHWDHAGGNKKLVLTPILSSCSGVI